MAYTNTQPSLAFSEPTTSRDAAYAMVPKAQIQRDRVLAFIVSMGAWGATQKEAAHRFATPGQDMRPSMCARFHELEKAGQIVKTSHRRERCAVYSRPWVALVTP